MPCVVVHGHRHRVCRQRAAKDKAGRFFVGWIEQMTDRLFVRHISVARFCFRRADDRYVAVRMSHIAPDVDNIVLCVDVLPL